MTAPGQSDPLKELLTVQKRMNKLFDSALGMTDFDTHEGVDTWVPVCDAFMTSGALVLCLELPGLDQDQIELKLEGDDLIVAGEREMDRGRAGERFHRVERSYGKFSRRFRLPSTVNRSAVDATYRDGLLRVVLPKSETKPPQAIRVDIS